MRGVKCNGGRGKGEERRREREGVEKRGKGKRKEMRETNVGYATSIVPRTWPGNEARILHMSNGQEVELHVQVGGS